MSYLRPSIRIPKSVERVPEAEQGVHELKVSVFDAMVMVWTPQIKARYYGEGEIVGDESIEGLGAALGLTEFEISDAFVAARAVVDSERQVN